MANSLFDAIKNFCIQQGVERTYHIGLSGGLDSVVLLHVFVQVRSFLPIQLHAVHVHHGLSKNADEWEKHCKKLCSQFNVDISTFKVDAKNKVGESPEAAARFARYSIFKNIIQANDLLITAHHEGDQAETVFLQLLRGSGPKGLAAMGRFMPFHVGFLARPFLDFSRETLEEYAKSHHLSWVEDESNTNLKFARNFIRHQVIPLLKTRWISINNILLRVAQHCATTQSVFEKYLSQDLLNCVGTKSKTLSIKKLLSLDEEKIPYILRHWLQSENISIPSTQKIKHIVKDVLQSAQDKQPCVQWGNIEIRRYRDDLFITKMQPSHLPAVELEWNFHEPLCIPHRGKLTATKQFNEGLSVKIDKVLIRFRQQGEKCQLPGRKHHDSLKKLFQQWGVPPWERDDVPLVFFEGQLISAVGFFVAEGFKAKYDEEGWIINYERNWLMK